VLEGAEALERQGWRCTVAPVRRDGLIDLAALHAVVGPDTAFVSVMAANNEIGVVQPLAEIGAIAHAAGAVFHVDAAQAVGKVPMDVNAMQIDLLSLTGHKMYGPKGSGAIFVRKRTRLNRFSSAAGRNAACGQAR
jgi:cysteine desulfurase